MTEEEKIFAGCMFNNRTPELVQRKRKAHRACLRFNQLDESDPARQPIIKEIIGSIGSVYYFQGPLQFNYGCHTHIGNNFFANFNLTVMDDGPIYIGDNVCLGPNVSLMATNHPLLAQERLGLNEQGKMTMAEYAQGIHIGSNVWIARFWTAFILAVKLSSVQAVWSPKTFRTTFLPMATPVGLSVPLPKPTAKRTSFSRKIGSISNII